MVGLGGSLPASDVEEVVATGDIIGKRVDEVLVGIRRLGLPTSGDNDHDELQSMLCEVGSHLI